MFLSLRCRKSFIDVSYYDDLFCKEKPSRWEARTICRLFQVSFLLIYIFNLWVCLSLYMSGIWRCSWKLEKGVGPPGIGVIDNFELFNMGARSQTQVLWEVQCTILITEPSLCPINDLLLLCLCIYVCLCMLLWVYFHHICVESVETTRGCNSPGSGVTEDRDLACGFSKQNLGFFKCSQIFLYFSSPKLL